MEIERVTGRQIIDSRGNPTVEADVFLKSGIFGRAAVPSGASTGQHEAVELRDGGSHFGGLGTEQAAANINKIISPGLRGLLSDKQQEMDARLIELDGTENKSKLGANAILAVSLAVADAAAKQRGVIKYVHINDLAGNPEMSLPLPMMNLLNGGKHATGCSDIQEFMIIPHKASSMKDRVRVGAEVFAALKKILKENDMPTSVGDEGGFAVPVENNSQPLELLERAIALAGYKPKEDISFALDVAASELYKADKYHLKVDGKQLNQAEMIKYLVELANKHPIISIEDGIDENDWDGWTKSTAALAHVQIVGDDFLVTNPKRLKQAIEKNAGNAILIKPNQIGTLSETLEAISMAKAAGWNTIVSHRSGETSDVSIVHIAVGAGAGQIKTGSLSRSERVSKYNELLRLEEIDPTLEVSQPFG